MEEDFQLMFEITGEPVSASILMLCKTLKSKEFGDSIGHEICMGIRKGLFGSSCGNDPDIRDMNVTVVE